MLRWDCCSSGGAGPQLRSLLNGHAVLQSMAPQEWDIHPNDIRIAKLPGGKDHQLGAGGFGKVSVLTRPRRLQMRLAGDHSLSKPVASQNTRWLRQREVGCYLGPSMIFCQCTGVQRLPA